MRVGSLKSGTDWRIVCAQLINHDSCVESWKKICIYSCVCLLVVLEHASILSLIYLFGSSYSHTNGKKNEITFRLDWQTKILALAISSGAWGDKVGPSYIINFRVGWIIGKQTKSLQFDVWHTIYQHRERMQKKNQFSCCCYEELSSFLGIKIGWTIKVESRIIMVT